MLLVRQLLAGATQAVKDADAAGVAEGHAGGLDGGTLFERWIKCGQWGTDTDCSGANVSNVALAIARAVVAPDAGCVLQYHLLDP